MYSASSLDGALRKRERELELARAGAGAAIAGAFCACAVTIPKEGPLGTISVRFKS